MKKKQLSKIFKDTPKQWGLRGDPYLWEELKIKLGGHDYPETEEELIALIEQMYQQLTDVPLNDQESMHRDSVFVERYSHGGMSSGCVSPRFRTEKAMPILRERYLKSRQ